MGLLTRLWDAIRWLIGLILPVFAKARDFRGMGSQKRWTLHVVLLLILLVALGFANYYLKIGVILQGPELLKKYLWAPLFFLLIYVLSWLGWWLWKLLGQEEDTSVFPDIDEAWEEAVRALHAAGIDLTEAPLFLLFGRPTGGEEGLMSAAQLQLSVKQAPRGQGPLHVYANRDGIYVTCAGASLLGRQAAILAGEVDAGLRDGAADMAAAVDGGGDDPYKTLQPKGRHQREIQAILARAHEARRELSAEEKQRIRQLDAEDKTEGVRGRPRPQLLKNPAEADYWTARLKHLCRLIVRDRRPYCPINGMLVLVPLAAGDSDADAEQTAALCQYDLRAAREVLQVHCPIFALVCDLEALAGFREFLARFPEDQRQRRFGQRFPLMPDLDAGAIPGMIEGGVQWICQALFPMWVYRLLRLETPGREDAAAAVHGNARLYQLMCQMREGQKRLSRVFTRGIVAETDGPLLFGGCYVAATGRDSTQEQAFVPGVFRRLVDNQSAVSWTSEALAEEAEYQRMTTIGYVGAGIFAVLVLGLGLFLWAR